MPARIWNSPPLQVRRPLHGRNDAVELGEQSVAHGLEDLAALLADGAGDQPVVDPLHEAQGLPFTALHEAGIAHHVERHYRDQTSVGLGHLAQAFQPGVFIALRSRAENDDDGWDGIAAGRRWRDAQ